MSKPAVQSCFCRSSWRFLPRHRHVGLSFLAIGMLVVFAACGWQAKAKRRNRDRGPMGGMVSAKMAQKAAEQLAFDAKLQTQIKALALSSAQKTIDLRAELEKGQLGLQMLLDEPGALDESKIMAAIEANGKIRVTLRKSSVQEYFSLRQLLTLEQLAQVRNQRKARARQPRRNTSQSSGNLVTGRLDKPASAAKP